MVKCVSLMTHVRWVALCALCPLFGCMTVKTSRTAFPAPPNRAEAVPGIPFYIKTAACKHQAVWAEMRYDIQYSQVTAGDSTANRAGEKTVGGSEAGDIALLTQISGKKITDPTDRKKYRAALDRIVAARPVAAPTVKSAQQLSNDPNVQLVSDTASIEPYVDYSVLYYYNTARPLIGTAKADVHLAADGTLTEGVSELTDTTGSTIASFVTSLGGMAVGAGSKGIPRTLVPSGQAPSLPGTSDTFTFTVSVKTYEHTIEEWKKDVKDPASCTVAWLNPSAYSLNTVTLAPDASANKKAPVSKNAVQFNGEIQLPAATSTSKDESSTTKGAKTSPN